MKSGSKRTSRLPHVLSQSAIARVFLNEHLLKDALPSEEEHSEESEYVVCQ
jgi:hypothetical protein